jgi:hypothetical protein
MTSAMITEGLWHACFSRSRNRPVAATSAAANQRPRTRCRQADTDKIGSQQNPRGTDAQGRGGRPQEPVAAVAAIHDAHSMRGIAPRCSRMPGGRA